MSVFCLLFVPLFYFFRRSVTETNGSGGVWALLLGSLTAVIQFFLGYFVSPGGFGLTRWLFGFVDIVSVPVILPLVIYSILFLFRSFSGEPDFTNFTLLWLIPVAVLRAIAWSETSDSILLIAAPILWTSLAVGIPFFISRIFSGSRWYIISIFILCILLMPVLAAAVYWAFFSQITWLGFLLLFVVNIPLVLDFMRK